MGGIQVGFGAEGGVLGNPGDFPSVPGRTPREGAGLGWMLCSAGVLSLWNSVG